MGILVVHNHPQNQALAYVMGDINLFVAGADYCTARAAAKARQDTNMAGMLGMAWHE
jgi:hypothetical protein